MAKAGGAVRASDGGARSSGAPMLSGSVRAQAAVRKRRAAKRGARRGTRPSTRAAGGTLGGGGTCGNESRGTGSRRAGCVTAADRPTVGLLLSWPRYLLNDIAPKRTTPVDELAPYAERLRTLPFVRGARARAGSIVVTTPAGKFELVADLRKSHVGRAGGEALLAKHQGDPNVVVLAPLIGAELGGRLADAEVNFVDADGNCFVKLDDRYIARIQQATRGRREESASGGIRAAGYQVLFGLLANDQLRLSTVRALAAATGVSMAPAHQIRGRLVEQGLAWRGHDGQFSWFPDRFDDAVAMFVTGYGTVLRKKLLVGRFRTPDQDVDACERRIADALRDHPVWAFGGGSAAQRITGHYHGPNVTLHLHEPTRQTLRAIKAIPDRDGPLVVLRSPGAGGLEGPKPHVAHPLLVHAELLHEGGERAREAAIEVLKYWRRPSK
jgi:hypothetical protein